MAQNHTLSYGYFIRRPSLIGNKLAKASLSFDEICERRDRVLQVEFTFLKNDQPAEVIAGLARMEQDYILNWVERIASSNIQIAYQFITRAIDGLASMDKQIIEAWGMHAMGMYDKSGLHAAMEVMKSLDNSFVEDNRIRTSGAVLKDVSVVLQYFCHGLSGRQLKIEEAQQAWTDTESNYARSSRLCVMKTVCSSVRYTVMVWILML